MTHGDESPGIPWPTKEQVMAPEHEPEDAEILDAVEAAEFSKLTVYTNEDDVILVGTEDSDMLFQLDVTSGGFKAYNLDPETVKLDALTRLS